MEDYGMFDTPEDRERYPKEYAEGYKFITNVDASRLKEQTDKLDYAGVDYKVCKPAYALSGNVCEGVALLIKAVDYDLAGRTIL